MDILNELTTNNRLLTVLHDNLPAEIKSSDLYKDVTRYFQSYCTSNGISAASVDDTYTKYITAYNKHCKQFIKTGKYPLENGLTDFELSREEYDVVLLISVLFAPHRFRIMELLSQQQQSGRALFIGLGPGLELFLTQERHSEIDAYDVSINENLPSQFPRAAFHATYYTGQNQAYYDSIYLIEILEHLSDPFDLLHICAQSLRAGGQIMLTTATDIPQFDHLYNFPDDHSDFEKKCIDLGLTIEVKEKLVHKYLSSELQPSNHFYILQKTR